MARNRSGPPGTRRRAVGNRTPRACILIVCEGSKTEPNYFRRFPVTSLSVEVVGSGSETESVVSHAESLVRRSQNRYDQVWCVFDRDSFPPERFNRALERAVRRGFHVAWSNECFEIWYILHFCYLDAAVSRDTYNERLSGHLSVSYRKNSVDIFDRLLPRVQEALRNAKRLRASYSQSGQLLNPEKANPATTVDLLVELLLQHMR